MVNQQHKAKNRFANISKMDNSHLFIIADVFGWKRYKSSDLIVVFSIFGHKLNLSKNAELFLAQLFSFGIWI